LESILEIVTVEYALDVLSELLDDLKAPPPNGNHSFFAEHTHQGGFHITTNFDRCIESANGDVNRVLHVHGSLGESGDVAQLVT
jgi:NAD-dependent SIR2 family protein deacetylase